MGAVVCNAVWCFRKHVHALSTRCFCGCSNVGVGAVGIIAIAIGLRKVANRGLMFGLRLRLGLRMHTEG